MPAFDLGNSGALPDAQTARATDMMMSQGQFRVPIDSGYGDVYRPFATGYKDQRILTLETLYDFFINNVPDPDSALAQDPNFDEKLENHPDVAAAFRIRELTVASMDAQIVASSKAGIDPDFAEKIRAYVEDVIDSMPNKVEWYRQMQRAVLLGGQGHEYVWARVDGVERPVEYYPVHKSRFVFDRLGSMAVLTRTTPVWGAYVARNPSRMPNGEYAFYTPGGRFSYHKYMAEGGPWNRPADEGFLYWGRGEDTRLYIPVTFDHFVIRFRMKWLEKHGMPYTLLYHPDNWNPAEVMQIANSIRGESVARIPKPVGKDKNHFFDVDFEQPAASGVDAFEAFQDRWVKPRIEKIILGSANSLDEAGSKGGYAGKVAMQDNGPSMIFRYDARNIDETINHQLIPYIVWGRWPGLGDEYFPKHMMEGKEEKDEKARLEVAQMASAMVPIREEDIYEASGYEKPGEEDPVVFNPQQMDDPFGGMGGMDGGGNPGIPGAAPPGLPPTAEPGGVSQDGEMAALEAPMGTL